MTARGRDYPAPLEMGSVLICKSHWVFLLYDFVFDDPCEFFPVLCADFIISFFLSYMPCVCIPFPSSLPSMKDNTSSE